ncbi:hypothetical protein MGYG_03280 [Nannizzia gypsea CBS 118893]|uniref:Uncharacterized protein n=1 Tax=Arthroderma gypseum (strain ATCC MYA-4604 / CBS 118893) TaxID=535722 RepID=E4UMS3_ARTGP|nr:hypothetical protein MGYG_03280 [Nannizzia gypsea CBS 118893]EFR00277.1 hypothetical protein MGYG_03280 [Nannizzia gypsea CBS 118893]
MEVPKTHGISANIYGRGDRSLGDRPCHVGLAVYELGSDICEMHHIRCPQDDMYIYDPRTQPLEDSVLRGRCELVQVSTSKKQTVIEILDKFGLDSTNIPEVGVGNCQDWLADAVQELEKHGILPDGEGDYWRNMINLTSDQMKKRCEDDGKQWIDGPGLIPFDGIPDARYSDVERRNIGKLAQSPIIQEKLESLIGNKVGSGPLVPDDDPHRLYVSSPFFSQTRG